MSNDKTMEADKAKVLAVHPYAYVCSEEGEELVFITTGPLRDLSNRWGTEAEAWADAASRLPAGDAGQETFCSGCGRKNHCTVCCLAAPPEQEGDGDVHVQDADGVDGSNVGDGNYYRMAGAKGLDVSPVAPAPEGEEGANVRRVNPVAVPELKPKSAPLPHYDIRETKAHIKVIEEMWEKAFYVEQDRNEGREQALKQRVSELEGQLTPKAEGVEPDEREAFVEQGLLAVFARRRKERMSTPGRENMRKDLEAVFEAWQARASLSKGVSAANETDAALVELRKDKQRLDWLTSKEANLMTHREKLGGGYGIWWNVVKRQVSISGHPLGSPRTAIDFAMQLASSKRKPAAGEEVEGGAPNDPTGDR